MGSFIEGVRDKGTKGSSVRFDSCPFPIPCSLDPYIPLLGSLT
jgi:hypothetical protein